MWVHLGSICVYSVLFDSILVLFSDRWFFRSFQVYAPLCESIFPMLGFPELPSSWDSGVFTDLTAFAWIQFGCVLGPLESSWSSFPEHTCLEHLRCDFYAKTEGGGPSRQRNSSSISTKKHRSPIAREKNILVVVTIRIFRNALIMFERKHSITF
jgi:hypothetical protein